ncbi:MAG: putative TonB-dependent receptor [Pedosphaera sp.]|nr:putative TonB-dependent receptor [Pedosphaera sp.]
MQERASSRRKKNSPKVNLVVSLVFHGVLAFFATFWAAHEGVFGERMKEITVAIVPKEKPPEPEKPPPPPPKLEPPKEEPKAEPPKIVEPPKLVAAAPPPPQAAEPQTGGPAVAPAAASLPDFAFNDGAKLVETGTNAALAYYKSAVEYTLRSNWDRPTDVADDNFVAEVDVYVDPTGRITGTDWKRGSGNKKWDDSVRKAIAAAKQINRPQPKGFPGKFLVRFDVQPATTEVMSQ